MKKNIEVVIYEEESVYDIPENATDFMTFWQHKLDQIPEELKDNARIEIEPEISYDCPQLAVKVYYTRPETDTEEQARKLENLAQKNAIECREREELAKLKEKYHDA